MFQRSLWDGSRIGERKKTVISNAERIVLRNMYPPGCRVELEDMEADPYVKLSPGDLGTVQWRTDTCILGLWIQPCYGVWCRSLQMCYERGTFAGDITKDTGYAI